MTAHILSWLVGRCCLRQCCSGTILRMLRPAQAQKRVPEAAARLAGAQPVRLVPWLAEEEERVSEEQRVRNSLVLLHFPKK